jgi:hypothetical protein
MLKPVTTYTDYFGIHNQVVPFENLNAFRDTPLFVDPHAIRFADMPQPYQQNAIQSLDTFLNALSFRVIQTPADSGELLRHISEPKETRLGMARNGYYGHAASDVLAEKYGRSLLPICKLCFALES